MEGQDLIEYCRMQAETQGDSCQFPARQINALIKLAGRDDRFLGSIVHLMSHNVRTLCNEAEKKLKEAQEPLKEETPDESLIRDFRERAENSEKVYCSPEELKKLTEHTGAPYIIHTNTEIPSYLILEFCKWAETALVQKQKAQAEFESIVASFEGVPPETTELMQYKKLAEFMETKIRNYVEMSRKIQEGGEFSLKHWDELVTAAHFGKIAVGLIKPRATEEIIQEIVTLRKEEAAARHTGLYEKR